MHSSLEGVDTKSIHPQNTYRHRAFCLKRWKDFLVVENSTWGCSVLFASGAYVHFSWWFWVTFSVNAKKALMTDTVVNLCLSVLQSNTFIFSSIPFSWTFTKDMDSSRNVTVSLRCSHFSAEINRCFPLRHLRALTSVTALLHVLILVPSDYVKDMSQGLLTCVLEQSQSPVKIQKKSGITKSKIILDERKWVGTLGTKEPSKIIECLFLVPVFPWVQKRTFLSVSNWGVLHFRINCHHSLVVVGKSTPFFNVWA